MTYYHGTAVGGITVLMPHASPASNYAKPCVYLSANKPVAALYIWNRPYKWFTFEFAPDGTPVYRESFPGSLREFYGGQPGYIYTCEGDFSSDNPTGIQCAAISERPVEVTGCEAVDDACALLLQYEREGTLIIRRHGALTEAEHAANRNMVLGAIRRLNLLEGEHPLSPFVREKFPALWAEADQ